MSRTITQITAAALTVLALTIAGSAAPASATMTRPTPSSSTLPAVGFSSGATNVVYWASTADTDTYDVTVNGTTAHAVVVRDPMGAPSLTLMAGLAATYTYPGTLAAGDVVTVTSVNRAGRATKTVTAAYVPTGAPTASAKPRHVYVGSVAFTGTGATLTAASSTYLASVVRALRSGGYQHVELYVAESPTSASVALGAARLAKVTAALNAIPGLTVTPVIATGKGYIPSSVTITLPAN